VLVCWVVISFEHKPAYRRDVHTYLNSTLTAALSSESNLNDNLKIVLF
jgi:hypothetical protein